MGEYSVLGFCIDPRCARANTASLELNIPPYYSVIECYVPDLLLTGFHHLEISVLVEVLIKVQEDYICMETIVECPYTYI